ncbi:MAG: dihydrolipoamide acetyltransferase family protein [Terriglobales bacterium]
MAFSVVMPALEMAQETGKLVAWLKKEGEAVSKGEPLLEVETDKAVMEVEAQAEGILTGIKARAGDVIPVGQTIAWIVRPGETVPSETLAYPSSRVAAVMTGAQSSSATPPAAAEPVRQQARMSPKARRLAKEHGVDLSHVQGSGPGGEVTSADVLAAVASVTEPATSVAPEVRPLSAVARLMAERTTESWIHVPHFFLVREVDAGALLEARKRLAPAVQEARGIRLTHTDLLIALVARVLKRHPHMNASWNKGQIDFNSDVNIAVAIAVEDGVVAAVVHRADIAELGEIAVETRALAERARAGRLRPTDVSGATFTISNLGMYEVDAFSAVITAPQSGVLAVGRIANRVIAANGAPVVRPMMCLTLSSDHRVVDGAKAAMFLRDLAQVIGDPMQLLA